GQAPLTWWTFSGNAARPRVGCLLGRPGGQLDEPLSVFQRDLVHPSYVELRGQIERKHLGPLALDHGPVLLLHDALERQEVRVVLLEGVVAGEEPEAPCRLPPLRRGG